jgi:hypothetical protein
VIGAAQSPARAIYPPTAIAPLVPILRAPEAVPRIVFYQPSCQKHFHRQRFSVAYATAWNCRPKRGDRAEHDAEEKRRQDTTGYLSQDVARHSVSTGNDAARDILVATSTVILPKGSRARKLASNPLSGSPELGQPPPEVFSL